jgi:hypothetical protein
MLCIRVAVQERSAGRVEAQVDMPFCGGRWGSVAEKGVHVEAMHIHL